MGLQYQKYSLKWIFLVELIISLNVLTLSCLSLDITVKMVKFILNDSSTPVVWLLSSGVLDYQPIVSTWRLVLLKIGSACSPEGTFSNCGRNVEIFQFRCNPDWDFSFYINKYLNAYELNSEILARFQQLFVNNYFSFYFSYHLFLGISSINIH